MNESGYTPKDLHFDQEARERLVSGIEKIAKAVKSTMGPMGKTVIIESPNHTHGITVTKDGVTVAKAVALLDPIENLAVKMVREAADRTALSSGDGTTTAIVLTEAIVMQGLKLIEPHHNVSEIMRCINRECDKVIAKLDKASISINDKRLKDVATISANNDPEIGQIIYDTYKKVGLKDGIVTVEKSQTTETTSDVTDGIKIDRGYTSPLFINNHKKDECIFENVHILVTDSPIENLEKIASILNGCITDGRKLLILGPCSQNSLNALAANAVRGKLQVCNVLPPDFGFRKHELMSDIALSVGAKYFSEQTIDSIQFSNVTDLGKADKVIVGRDSTVIIGGGGEEEDVNVRIDELKAAKENSKKKDEKDFIQRRIAGLRGSIGVIRVGGNSDVEQKELYDRVDDAACAVRSALDDGVLPGGGVALHNESVDLLEVGDSQEQAVANKILLEAIKAPMVQILDNAGLDHKEIVSKIQCTANGREGYDVKNGEHGDMIDMGIIDPTKVTKNALRNAVSVATTILGTNAIITMARSYETSK